MRYLLIFFILMPIVEMWLLIEVGQQIGAPLTIAAVVATAALGVYWLKQQGVSTLTRLNQRMQSGEIPAQELAEGVMLAIAGALLLTPGFATDALGFACLFPLSRQWMAKRLFRFIQANMQMNIPMNSAGGRASARYSYYSGGGTHSHTPRQDSRDTAHATTHTTTHTTIDGEFSVENPDHPLIDLESTPDKGRD